MASIMSPVAVWGNPAALPKWHKRGLRLNLVRQVAGLNRLGLASQTER